MKFDMIYHLSTPATSPCLQFYQQFAYFSFKVFPSKRYCIYLVESFPLLSFAAVHISLISQKGPPDDEVAVAFISSFWVVADETIMFFPLISLLKTVCYLRYFMSNLKQSEVGKTT